MSIKRKLSAVVATLTVVAAAPELDAVGVLLEHPATATNAAAPATNKAVLCLLDLNSFLPSHRARSRDPASVEAHGVEALVKSVRWSA